MHTTSKIFRLGCTIILLLFVTSLKAQQKNETSAADKTAGPAKDTKTAVNDILNGINKSLSNTTTGSKNGPANSASPATQTAGQPAAINKGSTAFPNLIDESSTKANPLNGLNNAINSNGQQAQSKLP